MTFGIRWGCCIGDVWTFGIRWGCCIGGVWTFDINGLGPIGKCDDDTAKSWGLATLTAAGAVGFFLLTRFGGVF